MRKQVLKELRQSQSVIAGGDEVMPRFWIDTPQGAMTVMIELPPDITARNKGMQLIADFMAWRQATSFIHSAETMTPDLVFALGIARDKFYGLYSHINRKPVVTFARDEKLPLESVGDEIPAMLPRGVRSIDAARVGQLQEVFNLYDGEDIAPLIVIRMSDTGQATREH